MEHKVLAILSTVIFNFILVYNLVNQNRDKRKTFFKGFKSKAWVFLVLGIVGTFIQIILLNSKIKDLNYQKQTHLTSLIMSRPNLYIAHKDLKWIKEIDELKLNVCVRNEGCRPAKLQKYNLEIFYLQEGDFVQSGILEMNTEKISYLVNGRFRDEECCMGVGFGDCFYDEYVVQVDILFLDELTGKSYALKEEYLGTDKVENEGVKLILPSTMTRKLNEFKKNIKYNEQGIYNIAWQN